MATKAAQSFAAASDRETITFSYAATLLSGGGGGKRPPSWQTKKTFILLESPIEIQRKNS